jgi:exopolysaccharide production protein ExoZ
VTLAAQRASREGTFGSLRFAAARVLRIYPVYWSVLILAFPLAETLVLAAPMPPQNVLRVIFALTTSNPKVMLAWTLYFELFFYAMLAIVLLLGKRFFRNLLLWGLLEVVAIALGATVYPSLADDLFASPMILEFIGGCGIAYLVHLGLFRFSRSALALGLISFVVGAVVHAHQAVLYNPWARTVCFGAPS